MKNKTEHLDQYTPLAANKDFTDNAWTNNKAAEQRYEAVAAILDAIECTSVVDYGCGTGHLSQFIGDIAYKGYDMTPAFVAKGRSLYNIDINLVDGEAIPDMDADAVVCLGTYSMKMSESAESYALFAESQIKELLSKNVRYVVVVGFRKLNDFEDDHLFYTDVDSLLALGDKLGVGVTVSNLLKHNFIAVFDKDILL